MDLIKNRKYELRVLCLVILISSMVMVSCKNQSFEKRLINYTEQSCKFLEQKQCVIDLNEFVGKKIDSVLIFDAGTIDYDISRVLKYKYESKNDIDDESKRIMFISKGKIIQEGDVHNNKMCFLGADSVLSTEGKAFYFCRKYNRPKLFVERNEQRDANNVFFYYSFK